MVPAGAGRARFDIGEIVRTHRAQLEAQHRLTREQKRVLTDIGQCRTAALGGHVDHCPSCGYEHPSYNSCRNRHCPKCQALAQEKWIEQRRERLLDVGHFHVVFTLPAELRFLAKLAPREVFEALFHAASLTLLELGKSELGVMLGATLVLHTWTRELSFHPHVHAIVTAGGLALDGKSFRHGDPKFLFHVKRMGLLLRGKVLAALSEAYAAGAFAHVPAFDDPAGFGRLIAKVAKLSWNVYAKEPFDTSSHVVAYLGRYTHRVGIANSRLLDVTPDRVVFRTRGDETATLSPVDFLWRFVQHVLPDGFRKVRHIGLYASPKLAVARERLGMSPPTPAPKRTWEQKLLELTGRDVRLCPRCLAPLRSSVLPRDVLHNERAPPLANAA
jgi:Putative transposase/Transposase zinc-binding domain